MQPLTDLQTVFQDGYSFEYDYPPTRGFSKSQSPLTPLAI
jgi:hypothetical protein